MSHPRARLPFAPVPLVLALALGGCNLAPTYKTPDAPALPAQYREQWQPAQPADQLPRDHWWTLYGDTDLNDLSTRLDAASPDLAQALARYDAASAFSMQAEAARSPVIGVGSDNTRNAQSENRPLRGVGQPNVYNDNQLSMGVSYEVDLWGRVRNTVARGHALLSAASDDLASARLSLHAQLADQYFELRSLDRQQSLLNDTITAYARALLLTEARHDGGIASGLDVARAQEQLNHAKALAKDVQARRAVAQHAIASLIGEPASTFTIAPRLIDVSVPVVPTGTPASILQRRPDIAAAERRIAAANANVGIAKVAFYPALKLSASGGFESTSGNDWLSSPNTFWSLGPATALTLFDGGYRRGVVREYEAKTREAAAFYRSTVLTALQQVEDNLALLRQLNDAWQDESAAVTAGQNAYAIALNRYREGSANYLVVTDAQTALVQSQLAEEDLLRRRLHASVGLIRALGGGWTGG